MKNADPIQCACACAPGLARMLRIALAAVGRQASRAPPPGAARPRTGRAGASQPPRRGAPRSASRGSGLRATAASRTRPHAGVRAMGTPLSTRSRAVAAFVRTPGSSQHLRRSASVHNVQYVRSTDMCTTMYTKAYP